MKRHVDLTQDRLFSQSENTNITTINGIIQDVVGNNRIRIVNSDEDFRNVNLSSIDYLIGIKNKKYELKCPRCDRTIYQFPWTNKIGVFCGRCMRKYGGDYIDSATLYGWEYYEDKNHKYPWTTYQNTKTVNEILLW